MDGLSLQLQYCVQTVEVKVNARLEVFFAFQAAMNEQLAYNRQVTKPLSSFPHHLHPKAMYETLSTVSKLSLEGAHSKKIEDEDEFSPLSR